MERALALDPNNDLGMGALGVGQNYRATPLAALERFEKPVYRVASIPAP